MSSREPGAWTAWVLRNNHFNEWQAGEETVKKQKQTFQCSLIGLDQEEGIKAAIPGSLPRTVSSHKELCAQPCAKTESTVDPKCVKDVCHVTPFSWP